MIGMPQPCALNIELDNSGRHSGKPNNGNPHLAEDLETWIVDHIDLSPKGIIERFDGLKPRFYEVTQRGHFGHADNELEKSLQLFPWEATDIADSLKEYF